MNLYVDNGSLTATPLGKVEQCELQQVKVWEPSWTDASLYQVEGAYM